jgi:hypothetical protein
VGRRKNLRLGEADGWLEKKPRARRRIVVMRERKEAQEDCAVRLRRSDRRAPSMSLLPPLLGKIGERDEKGDAVTWTGGERGIFRGVQLQRFLSFAERASAAKSPRRPMQGRIPQGDTGMAADSVDFILGFCGTTKRTTWWTASRL